MIADLAFPAESQQHLRIADQSKTAPPPNPISLTQFPKSISSLPVLASTALSKFSTPSDFPILSNAPSFRVDVCCCVVLGVVLPACVARGDAVDRFSSGHGPPLRSGHPRQHVGGVSQALPLGDTHPIQLHGAAGPLHQYTGVSRP